MTGREIERETDRTSRASGPDPELVTRLVRAMAPRLEQVLQRIAATGANDVTLLPVSKAKPAEAVLAAVELGLDSFGENYAQELRAKADLVGEANGPATWHFIGQLQTNKVKLIADLVEVWQSVDRPKVGSEIAKRAPGATVFAQVNLTDDPNKAGCSFAEVGPLVEHLLAVGLRVDGLMGVGHVADDDATIDGFRRLRALVEQHRLRHCSMGMTADLELAIAEGSTMVRVGTALFGPRP